MQAVQPQEGPGISPGVPTGAEEQNPHQSGQPNGVPNLPAGQRLMPASDPTPPAPAASPQQVSCDCCTGELHLLHWIAVGLIAALFTFYSSGLNSRLDNLLAHELAVRATEPGD